MRHRKPEAVPDDDAPVALAQRPTRWTVRIRTVAYVLVGLAVAASLASVYLTYQAAQDSAAQAAAVERRLAVLEEDLAERTRQRDEERDAAAARAAEDREQFRARFCEVLTELSATFPNLDRLREALGCTQLGVAAGPPARSSPGASTGQSPATTPAEPPPAANDPAPQPPTTQDPPPAPPDGGRPPLTELVCDAVEVLCPSP